MEHFTPWTALAGGGLIGLAAALLFAGIGRVAGISGIAAGLLSADPAERTWRVLFTAGLLVGGIVLLAVAPEVFAAHPGRSTPAIVLAGLLVGFGTRLGNGCTSGHGVCGIPRGSTRSIVATLVFIATGVATVTLIRTSFGGTL